MSPKQIKRASFAQVALALTISAVCQLARGSVGTETHQARRIKNKEMSLVASAHSLGDLRQKQQAIRNWSQLRSRCDLELQTSEVPASCFARVNYERQLDYLTQREVALSLAVLEDVCLLRVAQGLSFDKARAKISEFGKTRNACRTEIERRLIQEEYKEIERDPQKVLQALFRRR